MRRRPNVLFILSDDQATWALGCYGNPEIRTPHLDVLARSGVRLDNFFCTSPVCSPARASLFTGSLPSQHGVHDWIREGNVGHGAIDYLQGRTTFTDLLADAGYRCGLFGKWHLGASDRPRRGFVHWFAHQKGGGPYHDAPMVRDSRLVTQPGYLTDALTDDACAFLRREAGSDAPFSLSLHYTAPHVPWVGQHPAELVALYDDCAFASCPQEPRHPWVLDFSAEMQAAQRHPTENLKGLFAAVTAMDAGIGRVLVQLDELGLREHTLVLFSSDNGFNAGHHGIWGKGNGTYPQNLYDTSVRVPFIASQPGRIPPGAVSDALVSGYDVMPTLLEYCGLPCADGDLPGHSFAPLLLGDAGDGADHVVVYDEYGPVRMLRTRDWKYVQRHPAGPHELYHLTDDPGERRNLADEPARRGQREVLHAQLAEWFARYVDPRADGASQPVTGVGQRALVGPGSDAFFPLPEGPGRQPPRRRSF